MANRHKTPVPLICFRRQRRSVILPVFVNRLPIRLESSYNENNWNTITWAEGQCFGPAAGQALTFVSQDLCVIRQEDAKYWSSIEIRGLED